MFFKLEKKAKKKENTWKIKKQNFKTEKNRKQNKWEKKGTSKRGKNGKKMDLSICIFVAFFLLFRFVFFAFVLLFFCFLPGKKQNKSKSKKQKKSNKNANGQVHFFPIFSPFCLSFLFPCFFPFILLLCFLDFADLLFGFSIFFAFFAFFSSFKKIRISYGLVNIMIIYVYGILWEYQYINQWLVVTGT